jgi:hypothetical protein
VLLRTPANGRDLTGTVLAGMHFRSWAVARASPRVAADSIRRPSDGFSAGAANQRGVVLRRIAELSIFSILSCK